VAETIKEQGGGVVISHGSLAWLKVMDEERRGSGKSALNRELVSGKGILCVVVSRH
jgi:hypothetical protein